MQKKIKIWKNIFDTEENAISKSLSELAWNFAVYSCIVEMVRSAPNEGEGKRINGMILDMIASGYWSNTMQGIRRLVDRETIHGKHGVCSLHSLISDVRANRHKITRKLFVEEIAGLPYDYKEVEKKYWKYLLQQHVLTPNWVPLEYHHEPSQQRHVLFDWLSGTSSDNAASDDLIRDEVFEALLKRLEKLKTVVEHVNVEIAHAATEASRRGRVIEQWGLDDAKAALKELSEVAELVGNWFCYSGIGTLLPTPQFNLFEHLDQPLFTGDMDRLQEVWDAIDAEMTNWHKVEADALLRSKEISSF